MHVRRISGDVVRWWVRRNPTYLVSAVLVAVAAQQMLRDPDAPAGEFGVILSTLGGLQLYEVAVLAVLCWLLVVGRSPEDRPALLLVATVFWSGPLAAATELLAVDVDLGRLLLLAAGVVAVIELELTRRWYRARIGWGAWAIAAGGIALVCCVPLVLRFDASNPAGNELLIYAAWWLLGLLTLGLLEPLRVAALRASAEAWCGLLVAGLTVASCAFQLWGLNYAAFTHARMFYAAPVIMAGAVVGMHAIARFAAPGWRGPLLLAAGCVAPLAFADTLRGFAEQVPTDALPAILRSPVPVVGCGVVAVWFYGAIRFGVITLAHAGVVAVAVGIAWGGVPAVGDAASQVTERVLAPASCGLLAVWALVLAAVLRRRIELRIGIVLAAASVAGLIDEHAARPGYLLALLAGWTVIALQWTAAERVSLGWRATPLVWTLVVALVAERHAALQAGQRAAVVATLLVVLVRSAIVRDKPLCWCSGGGLVGWGGYLFGDVAVATRHARALSIALGGFGLLGLGAWISWNKLALERRLGRAEE